MEPTLNRRSHIMSGDDYEAFLLEWRRDGTTYYWSLDTDGEVAWVLEADDAIHFARRSDAETILSYVYGREPGRPDLEIGGVMLTLGALSEVLRVSMDDQAERELSRVRADTEAIKLRDQAKPKLHMLGEGS